MFNVRLAGDHLYGKWLFAWLSLLVSLMGLLCCSFSHEMSWMRSGIELSLFLRIFLPTLFLHVNRFLDEFSGYQSLFHVLKYKNNSVDTLNRHFTRFIQ